MSQEPKINLDNAKRINEPSLPVPRRSKRYNEKGKIIGKVAVEGQKGSVTSRRDFKEAVAESEHKKMLEKWDKEYKEAKEHAEKVIKKHKK